MEMSGSGARMFMTLITTPALRPVTVTVHVLRAPPTASAGVAAGAAAPGAAALLPASGIPLRTATTVWAFAPEPLYAKAILPFYSLPFFFFFPVE